MKKIGKWREFNPTTRKIVLTMKLSLFLFFAFTMQLSAKVMLGQQVTLQLEDACVRDVLKELKEQTGTYFMYREEALAQTEKIDIDVKDENLEQVINDICEQASLNYQIVEDYVLINKAKKVEKAAAEIKKQKVTGKVVDDAGLPLPGVSVIVKGTTIGTSTDMDGRYSLEVEASSTILQFQFIGMKSQEVKVVDGKFIYNVSLSSSTEQLEEVTVTTGYVKIDRKLFTGSAVKLNAEDAKIDGVADVGRMLEGKVAGVQVQNVSGTFGAAPKIRVRGASSIYGDTKPLWVVDGVILEDMVEVDPDQLSSGDISTLISSSVAGLNADDIESFTILKDASATALYGARAMNGVIVITTKKGTAGKPRISVTSEFTVKAKPNYAQYDVMNSQEQMSVFREMERKGWLEHSDLMRSKNGGLYYKMYEQINAYDPVTGFGLENTPEARAEYLRMGEYANTNWFDLLFKNSVTQNHSVSISGGSENSRFYVSTSILNDSGWTLADKVKRYTVNMRGDFDLSEKISIGLMTKGSIREQKAPGTFNRSSDVVNGDYSRDFDINPFSFALNSSRTLRPYDEEGNYEYYRMNYAPFNILNEYENHYIDLNVLDLTIQGELDYKINPHLDYKFIGSVRYVKSTSEHQIKEGSNVAEAYRADQDATIADANKFLYTDLENPDALPEVVLPSGGFYNTEDNSLVNFIMRHMLNYNKTFDEIHSLNIMSGFEVKYADRQNRFMNGYGYQYDAGGTVNTDPDIIKMTTQGGQPYFGMSELKDRYVAAFANLGYSYLGKYTLNGTCRMDGSNRMGKSNSARWLPTWNISGKWNMKEEEWLNDVEWLSFLQLRATYGLTASMGPATNTQMVIKNNITNTKYEDERQNGLLIENLANDDLTWEKQYETNIGLDFGFFNNRISVQADYYMRQGFDLIAAVRTNGIGGEGWKYANYADMDSHGMELTLNTKNVISKNGFNWTSNITFAYNKNEIKKLSSQPMISDLVFAEGGELVGGPVRGLYSIPFAGLTNEGIPTFYNQDGEVTQEVWFQDMDVSHLKYEGPIDPKIVGGIGNNFKYKNWSLNVFTTFSFGNVIRLYPSFSARYSDMDAMSKDMNDRWMMAGDEQVTNVPGIISRDVYNAYPMDIDATYNAYNYSDVRVADGDFIRLKQISLSYKFPKALIRKIGLTNAELKAQGSNLWLLHSDDKLNGQDPEFFGSGGVALPVPRQYTFTLKLGL